MNSQNSTMIRTQALTRRFGTLTAVSQLNLEVSRGEILGLVSPDGAGKTTVLRLLCGLLDPTEGQAWVAGYDVVRNLEAVKDRIGYMAQRFALYADLTVEENMVFYADLFGVVGAERSHLMGSLLKVARMKPFRTRQAGKLSGGMKQKLALMCTLLHHPEVLFLDEPTDRGSVSDLCESVTILCRDRAGNLFKGNRGVHPLATNAGPRGHRPNGVRVEFLEVPPALGLTGRFRLVRIPKLKECRAIKASYQNVAPRTAKRTYLLIEHDSQKTSGKAGGLIW